VASRTACGGGDEGDGGGGSRYSKKQQQQQQQQQPCLGIDAQVTSHARHGDLVTGHEGVKEG
jgi:hypothetical protein